MVVRLRSYLSHFGVATYWPSNCALLYFYSLNHELMLQSLWATYFVFHWHWPVELYDHSKAFNHGFKTIQELHIHGTPALYCTVQHFWFERWTARRLRAPFVQYQMIMFTIILAHRMVYALKMQIWPLRLALLLDLSCLTCFYTWFQFPVLYDVNLKTNLPILSKIYLSSL